MKMLMGFFLFLFSFFFFLFSFFFSFIFYLLSFIFYLLSLSFIFYLLSFIFYITNILLLQHTMHQTLCSLPGTVRRPSTRTATPWPCDVPQSSYPNYWTIVNLLHTSAGFASVTGASGVICHVFASRSVRYIFPILSCAQVSLLYWKTYFLMIIWSTHWNIVSYLNKKQYIWFLTIICTSAIFISFEYI